MFKQIVNLMKLRIGVIMMLTALVAMIVTPGQSLDGVQILVLAFAVLISAGSAGAFNQYFEVDLDKLTPLLIHHLVDHFSIHDTDITSKRRSAISTVG